MNRHKVSKTSLVFLLMMMAALCLSAQEYSLNLNGNGQFANCGSSPDFNFSNAFTVEAWIYPTDFKADEHMNTIAAKTSWSLEFSHGWTFRYGSANRTLNFNMGGGAGVSWIDCKADGVLTLNTWQHVAATYDGASSRIYVNGTMVATQAFSGSITNAEEDLCIGSINNPSDMRYMTGKIDEVRIWNVVRSVSEIFGNVHHSITSPNLVAYYRMNSGSGVTLTDDSGQGHTAELFGSPTWVSELPREYSLKLNGTSQYATCGSGSDFFFTNQLTVEAWIYPTDFRAEEHMNTIVAKTNWYNYGMNQYTFGWTLRYGSSQRTLTFNMSDGDASWINCSADNVLNLNTWQHVAATYNGSTIKIYVNGALVATRDYTGIITNSNHYLCIGSVNGYSEMRYMKGSIDEVRIWNVARSASEIAANLLQCEIIHNLLAYYKMTNGSGTVLADNSGHGYHGYLIGNPIWDNTNPLNLVPIVRTDNPSPIGAFSATANGTIVSLGMPNPIQHGHCWNTDPSILPTIENSSRTQLGAVSSTGEFSSSIPGLSPCTYYKVRAYAIRRVGYVNSTTYGQVVGFYTSDVQPTTPSAQPASSITSSGFTANWIGGGYYSYQFHGYSSYAYRMDVSTDSDFSSFVSGYNNVFCGSHDNSSYSTSHSFNVTGLAAGTTYYCRIRAYSTVYSSYSNTITVTTQDNYNVSYNTGNISGVRIFTAESDFGIDPPSPLVLAVGFNGTIMAEKEGYIWSLAAGSDSNVISNLSEDTSISFVGTYRFVDPATPDFVYLGEPNVTISAEVVPLEDLDVPPPVDPGNGTVILFSGTEDSDIIISVPSGSWYAVAYYNDPADGGLAWHHASPYPAFSPQNIVFSNLPFGAKGSIPVALGPQDTTLPLELSSFTAIVISSECVDICWITQSETNIMGFHLYRNTSPDLISAIDISGLIEAGNSSQTAMYNIRDRGVFSEGCYYYWLQILEFNGTLVYIGPVCIMTDQTEDPELPYISEHTTLLPAYPNPFNPSTTIRYELNSPGIACFTIYNIKGQLVATHSQSHDKAGRFSWFFAGVDKDGRALASGTYICVMTVGRQRYFSKMVIVK